MTGWYSEHVPRTNPAHLSLWLAGRDGGGWAHVDGRGVWRWGRASDHAAGEHAVWRHQRPRRWRRLHQLAGARQQQPMGQQAAPRPGQQTREHGLPALPVKRHYPQQCRHTNRAVLSFSHSFSFFFHQQGAGAYAGAQDPAKCFKKPPTKCVHDWTCVFLHAPY